MMCIDIPFVKLVIIGICLFLFASCSKKSDDARVLVFTKSSGDYHQSIPVGVLAIMQLGRQHQFKVDTTSNAAYFNEDSLKKYAAVVFINTTGNLLNHYQEADFERYIQAGGGYMGIHAAIDAENDWGWYGRLTGARLLDQHGMNDSFPTTQEATITITDSLHNATKYLPRPWKHTDEYYNFNKVDSQLNILMNVDEQSYQGGKNGAHHPVAWYHEFEGGRAFYTVLGHNSESFSDKNFLQHVLGGIQYAIGGKIKLKYANASTQRVPEENVFTKNMLVSGTFFEPTEMTILPNLDILVAQRRGEIILYKKGDSSVRQVLFLPVYFNNQPGLKLNPEEGLLGLKADPNFEKNHFVYIFYSAADTAVNRLSRFTFEKDTINPASEKIVLEFNTQRAIGGNNGGSIAFDKDGLLYLSTGDNISPFNKPRQRSQKVGFAPVNDGPGDEPYDAVNTSGNSNDLRGKILRIRIKKDASYEIPVGNLYTKGQPGTRAEIYIQGTRNPYRISIDQKSNFLYWGEFGPDPIKDSTGKPGHRGYDEINQARKAGFFGWPFFIANNLPCQAYTFEPGQTAAATDTAQPIHAPGNNAGLPPLLPAMPALIWYSSGNSAEFPQVGSGPRNAMAGPVYYTGLYPKASRLPDYYDKKLFIYDRTRGWIKAVSFKSNGDFDKMEPFMEHAKFNGVVDMQVGPDGNIYLLESGSSRLTKNKDAGLARIDYKPVHKDTRPVLEF